MAKQDLNKQIGSLLRRLKSRYKPDPPTPRDPIEQLVVSFLQWRSSRRAAERAFSQLMAEMVDINEVRISHPHELLGVIGEDYPCAHERLSRLRESLNEIYRREHAVTLKPIAEANKKDQRAYLDSLAGMAHYVSAQVMLLSWGGHAMPVDEKLATLLATEQVVDPTATPDQVESLLLRHIRAGETLEAHLLFQSWSDASRISPERAREALLAGEQVETRSAKTLSMRKKPSRKRSTKKAARKKSSRSRTKKKK